MTSIELYLCLSWIFSGIFAICFNAYQNFKNGEEVVISGENIVLTLFLSLFFGWFVFLLVFYNYIFSEQVLKNIKIVTEYFIFLIDKFLSTKFIKIKRKK